ncbi:MAG: MBL fold metallo-hydrolase [Candidatus Peribacteraceae bacterium]|nr:MBL fold metallo-hydrolase [Candidatus Peribacteraceae bacterium]
MHSPLFLQRGWRWWLLASLLLAVLSAFAIRELSLLPDGKTHAFFLNVGEGDSILLMSPSGKHILVDGGPDLSALEELGKTLPFFHRSIDLLILTHPDLDHLSALPEVLRRYAVRRVLLPQAESRAGRYRLLLSEIAARKVPVLLVDSTQDIDLGDGVILDVLWPPLLLPEKFARDSNATSIVLKVLTTSGKTLLLTGDIEQNTERALLAGGIDLHATILKVPHHGSKTSSSTGFLLAVHPDTAILSVGEVNPFGHPAPAILDRYRTLGILLRSTAQEGPIHIDL